MRLTTILILFFLLLLAFIFGDNTISFGFHDTYYVISFMQLIILLLLIYTGTLLITSLLKKIATKKGKRVE